MNTDLITFETNKHIQTSSTIKDKDSLLYWLNLYFKTHIIGSAKTTENAKKNDLSKFLSFFGEFVGHDHIDHWTPSVTKKFISYLTSATSPTTEKKYKATSINRIIASTKTFAKWLHKQRPLIAGDPFERVKDITIEDPIWNGLTDIQIMRLKSACDHRMKACTKSNQNPIRETAIFYTLLTTGMRVNELVSLNINQYHSKGFHNVVRKGQKISTKIPLPQEAREYVDQYLEQRHNFDPNEPLFTSKNNNRLDTRDVRRICQKLINQANAYLPKNERITLTPHMLRHTFLKRVADKHGIHYAQKMSGNVSMREIFRYTKPSQEEIDKTAEELFD